jgi:hypothetical protein
MITRSLAAVALLLSSSCGASDGPAQAAVCRDHFAPIAAELRALPSAVPVPDRPAVELPVAHGARPTTPAPVVSVARDGTIALDGRVTDAAGVAEDLAVLGSSWSMTHDGATAPEFVYFAADRGVTVEQIAQLRTRALGERRAMLLAWSDAPPRTDPACPPSLGALCSQPPSDEDARAIGAALIPTCIGLRNAMIAMPLADRPATAQLLAGALEDSETAASTCRCDAVDLALVRWGALRLAGAFDRARAAFELPADPSPEERAETVEAWLASHAGAS